MLFRYEDLLTDPEKTIKSLCNFTDVEYVPEMMEPQKGNEKGQASSLTGERKKGFDKKAARRWERMISKYDKIFLTLFCRNSMERLGYKDI